MLKRNMLWPGSTTADITFRIDNEGVDNIIIRRGESINFDAVLPADTEGWSNGRDSNLTTSWSFSGNNTYVLSRSLAEDGGPENIFFADQSDPGCRV